MDEDEEAREERRRQKQIQNDIQSINTILSSAESILTRQRNIEDPVIRHTVFLDKLMMAVDIGLGVAKNQLDNEEYPQELKDRLDNLAKSLQNDLNDLMRWVQTPIYTPDHPYGNKLMKEAENHYHTQHN